MTLDGVIQNEENDGDGFKHGGWFFPFCGRTLGKGKRLFQDGTIPASFKVTSGQVAPKGILIASYERDGDVKTGQPQIEADS